MISHHAGWQCQLTVDCHTHRLSGPLHLRLLAALAADATNCGQLRILLAEREAILASLTIDRQKEVCGLMLRTCMQKTRNMACRSLAHTYSCAPHHWLVLVSIFHSHYF
jgi:hypothetical protein